MDGWVDRREDGWIGEDGWVNEREGGWMGG